MKENFEKVHIGDKVYVLGAVAKFPEVEESLQPIIDFDGNKFQFTRIVNLYFEGDRIVFLAEYSLVHSGMF